MKDFWKDDTNDKEKKRKRRIILYIIIIIIILLLISSCSCTSKFFGKIGDLFRNDSHYTIDDNSDNQEVIKNRDLKFDAEMVEMALSDSSTKISFNYRNINPGGFTCSTSDAEVATCYVANNYVVVIPKKSGEVTVYLQTNTNGKVYEATTKVVIKDLNRAIELEENSGTINIKKTNVKNVIYRLVGLSGNISVSSSDESIAKAEASNGILSIKAFKKGTVTITLSLTYNERSFTNSYTLTVIDSLSTSTTTKPNGSGNTNPGQGENPSHPSENNPIEEKESIRTLRSLTTNKGTLNFDPHTYSYSIGVGSWTRSITLKAQATSTKAKLSYTYNGQTVSSLNKLKLNTGDNIVLITVTAEDGSKSVYEVVINRAKSSKNYLKSLTTSVGELNPKFNKNTLFYDIPVSYDVDNLTLTAKPKSKKSIITYTFNGEVVTNLNDLKLKNGLNVVNIMVTSESGSTRTYTVNITKANAPGIPESDNLLKELTISSGTLLFDPYTNQYIVGVSYKTENVTLTAQPNSSKASVVYKYHDEVVSNLNDLSLRVGNNLVEVIVTAEDGSKNTYEVVINRSTPSNDNSLSNLETSVGVLTPSFEKDTLGYTISVDSKTQNITLTPTLANTNSSMKFTYQGKTVDDLNNLELSFGKNIVTITVTSEDGTIRTYEVVINKEADPTKANDSTLSSLEVLDGVGVLSPEFTKDIKEYVVEVSSTIHSISFEALLNDSKASSSYTFNGSASKTFKDTILDLPLVTGDQNVLIITGIAEDGITKTNYKVTIIKAADPEKSNNNLLSNLEVKNVNKGTLSPEFTPTEDHYRVVVSGSDNTIDIQASAASNKATISYIYSNLDGEEVSTTNGTNIPLKSGNNQVVVHVVAEDGTPKDYIVTVYKPVYTVSFHPVDTFFVEEKPFSISYVVKDEDGHPTDDYRVEDIQISLANFTDLFTVDTSKKGIITLIPDLNRLSSLVDQNLDVTITYNKDKKDTTNVKFTTYSYYLETYKNIYEVNLSLDRNENFWDVVLNTNLFTGNVLSQSIANGIQLYQDASPFATIDITSESDLIDLVVGDLKSPSSLTVRANAKNEGIAVIHVKGTYYGKEIAFDVTLNISRKYSVTIDAGEGFFDAFTTKYHYKFESGREIHLTDYKPYKADIEQDCMYFEIENYIDQYGKTYLPDETIIVDKDLVLTAQYKGTSHFESLSDQGVYLLKDIDLFYNPEYFKLYGEEKVIYPGTKGSHGITITNNKASKITITGMTLEEETICIDDYDTQGCLNMSYVIKRTDLQDRDVFYYPNSGNRYTILNIDANRNDTNNYRDLAGNYVLRTIDFAEVGKENIVLEKGDTVELSVLWEWAFDSGNDVLDTKIGSHVNDQYSFLISLHYEVQNEYCKNPDGTN